jgi:hypothetical protein
VGGLRLRDTLVYNDLYFCPTSASYTDRFLYHADRSSSSLTTAPVAHCIPVIFQAIHRRWRQKTMYTSPSSTPRRHYDSVEAFSRTKQQ